MAAIVDASEESSRASRDNKRQLGANNLMDLEESVKLHNDRVSSCVP